MKLGASEASWREEFLFTTVRLSCVPAQCVFMKCERGLFVVAVELKDEGSGGKMGTEYGSRSRPRWESGGGGRATGSVGGVGVDAARRTGRGGNRRGVGGVLPAVSIQAMRGVEATT